MWGKPSTHQPSECCKPGLEEGATAISQSAAHGYKSSNSLEKRIDLRQVNNYFRRIKEIFV
jgi:hypothetical protein